MKREKSKRINKRRGGDPMAVRKSFDFRFFFFFS